MANKTILGILLVLALVACTVTTSSGLSIASTSFATENAKGEMIKTDSDVFPRGIKVALLLQDVQSFQKGDDGKRWADLDVVITDASGEVVLDTKGILGEKAHMVTDESTLQLSAFFKAPKDAPVGKYTFKVTAYDKVAGTSATVSKPFTLK